MVTATGPCWRHLLCRGQGMTNIKKGCLKRAAFFVEVLQRYRPLVFEIALPVAELFLATPYLPVAVDGQLTADAATGIKYHNHTHALRFVHFHQMIVKHIDETLVRHGYVAQVIHI